jgi:hypothetical protein
MRVEKRRANLILVLLGVCCWAAPTWGSEAESTGVPQAEAPAQKPEVVCRRERVLGTHFKKRVCRTRTQIDEDQKNAQRHVREADRYRDATRVQTMPSG